MYIYTQILNIHTIICRLPIGGSRGLSVDSSTKGRSIRVDTRKKTPFDYWKTKGRFTPTLYTGPKNVRLCKKTNLRIYASDIFLQLKSLICTIFAGFWNLNMQFAWYFRRFGLESLRFICS